MDQAVAAAARRVFGDSFDRAARYATLLSTAGIERGLLGPREADRVWDRHLFNSAVVAPLVRESATVVDLGSGAGLPGIPIALARADLEVLLLEPMARRAQFLAECVRELDLPRVSVVHGRAEDGVDRDVDVVVARAVAPLDRLAPLALGLCRPDGVLLALKGAKAPEELASLANQRSYVARAVTKPDALGAPTTVVVVRRAENNARKAP